MSSMAIKKIDKDFEVSVINNTHGSFFYASPNGDFVIEMEQHGDEDYVTFSDLKSLMSRNRGILTDCLLVINEVVDEGFTIEEVIKSLRLEDSYNELLSLNETKLSKVDSIDINIIDDFVLEAEAEEIAKILGSKKSKIRYRVAEYCAELYKRNELTDYNKMKIVAEKLGHEDTQAFWKDIEASNM